MSPSRFFFISLFVFPLFTAAQIVNIEALRDTRDTVKFKGAENLNASYTRNTNELLTLSNNLYLRYKWKKSIILFYNTLDFSIANNTILEEKILFHLRYNYKIRKRLDLELFTQYQIDPPLRIQERILLGGGTRFELSGKESFSSYLGTAILYEYDNELGNDITHRDARLSAYLTLKLKPSETFSWTSACYYQPLVNYFNDFRISLQTNISVELFKNLFFVSSLALSYDAFPVDDPAIPHRTTKWVNGINYKF